MKKLLPALAWVLVLLSPLAGYAMMNATVVEKNKYFDRDSVTLRAGDQLTIKNGDGVKHDAVIITADGDSEDKGIQNPGEDIVVSFPKPGFYKVRCTIHSTMKLDVTVK
jgi:plastocyanin